MGLLDSIPQEELKKLLMNAQTQNNQLPNQNIAPQGLQEKLQSIENPATQSILNRFQVNGGGGVSGNTAYGGGRVGYTQPLDNGNLNVGMSGSAYKNPNGSSANINGVDARLTQGDNQYGVNYTQMSPLEKAIYFSYKKSF